MARNRHGFRLWCTNLPEVHGTVLDAKVLVGGSRSHFLVKAETKFDTEIHTLFAAHLALCI